MQIRTMYVNGDSWTFGQELRDDEPDHLTYKYYNTWPWHLSQSLEIPVLHNDALGGTSNDRIYRRTLDYIQNYKGDYDELLIIPAWTTYERREVAYTNTVDHDNGYTQWQQQDVNYASLLLNTKPNVNTGDVLQDVAISDWHRNSTILNNSQHNAQNFYNQQYSLKHICKSLGIHLIQTYALDNNEFVKGDAEGNEKWIADIDAVAPSMNRMLYYHPQPKTVRCPLKHPNELGHKYIAETLHPSIENYLNTRG